MIIGFTGTRNGMTKEQYAAVTQLVRAEQETARAAGLDVLGLHGECVGADADFDFICHSLGITTYSRPCTFESMRAVTYATPVAEPMAPMARNRAIVVAADIMIACPPNKDRIKKGSGTWATIGFAERAGTPLVVVYPDGSIDQGRQRVAR